MGHQIIRQPDGKLAVFSTGTDSWILYDATAEELLDHYAERAAQRAREDTQRAIDAVTSGEPRRVYYQFVMTFEEADRLNDEHAEPCPFEFRQEARP